MKKGVKSLIRLFSIFLCLFVVTNFFSGCSNGKNDDKTYAVTGYVFDELGQPVEGVVVSNEFLSATTDKDGKYVISNLDGSIVVSASKTGYKFAELSKFIASENDDANFVAYKEYTISGTAHNNGVAVANASVVLNSLSGEFYTTTDENGNFTVSGVAGETEISCEIDNLQFYSTKATIESPEVRINTTSSLTLNLEAEKGNIDFSKIELWINGKKTYLATNQKIISDVKCGTVVELVSDYYKFSGENRFVVDSLNQEENYVLSKIYDVNGIVKSGNVPLENANIYVDGKFVTTSDENGLFGVVDIWSDRELTIEHAGFKFNSMQVNENSTSAVFNGTKEIALTFDMDYDIAGEYTFSNNSYAALASNKYKFTDVCLGETITISSSDYHVARSEFVVDEADSYKVESYALYNAKVNGLVGNAEVLLDGKVVEQTKLQGLYGKHEISASFENYIFSLESVSFSNQVANLTYKIPYSVQLTIKSGDEIVPNSILTLADGTEKTANAEGVVVVENLTDKNELVVSAQNFNASKIIVESEENKVVNLTYNISGYAKSSTMAVQMATIKAGEKTTKTNESGYFEFKDLSGKLNIIAEKDGFEFDSAQVFGKSLVELDSTYKITGILTSEEKPVTDFTLTLVGVNDANDMSQVIPNEDGTYEFSDLSGEYVLFAVSGNGSIELKPTSYNILGSGTYNFSSSGFKVSGYVKSGDLCVGGAKVTAGATSTYTNELGYYCFELLTSACGVVVEKDGYVILNNNVQVSEDAENVNFNASYSISGTIKVGSEAIEGVSVYVNGSQTPSVETDDNGCFTLSGLIGSQTITFAKEGYSFDDEITIDSTTKNIVENTYEASAKIEAKVTVKTGDVPLVGFDYFVNEKKVDTSNKSTFELVADYGDKITFTKDGYSFDIITITTPKEYVVQSTYKVTGSVASGLEIVTGFEIFVNGESSNAQISGNKFEISGLSGNNVISFNRTGFTINSIDISEYQANINVSATYKVYGTVYVGSKTLAGVKVSLNETTNVTTDSLGKFEFSSVFGRFSIACEKAGYTFNAILDKFGEQRLTIDAGYSIAGYVKTGNLVLKNADVCLSSESSSAKYAKTDENGYFRFDNILGTASLIVTKDGYTSASLSGFNDLSLENTFNLSYSATIEFNGTGVTIYLNGEKKYDKTNSLVVNFSGLTGSNELKFEKTDITFTPYSVVTITGPQTVPITLVEAYDVSGYVKTTTANGDSLPIANAVVKIKNNSNDTSGAQEIKTTTDSNGYYELIDVAGTLMLESDYYSETLEITGSRNNYNFDVNTKDYAYSLYETALAKLQGTDDDADDGVISSIQVYGVGEVVGTAKLVVSIETTQYVYASYKRDNKGNIVKQNLNNGKPVDLMDIDPRISLLVAYNKSNDKWFNQLVAKSEVKSNTEATHTYGGMIETTPKAVQDTYGSSPYSFTPYAVSQTDSFSSFNFDGENYTFTINPSTSDDIQKGYATQIEALAPTGTDFLGFSSIVLNVTIDKNGWIKSIQAKDNYKIYQTTNVSIVSDMTYYFLTRGENEIVSDIVFDDTTVGESTVFRNSYKVEQTASASSNLSALRKYDIVTNTIYGKKEV